MGVVTAILAVFGKIILCILGILCILLLSVLFSPFRYQLQGEFHGSVKLKGNVHWLLFVFRLHFSYDQTLDWKLYLFGIDLMEFLDRRRGSRERHTKKGGRRKRGRKSAAPPDHDRPELEASEMEQSQTEQIPAREQIPAGEQILSDEKTPTGEQIPAAEREPGRRSVDDVSGGDIHGESFLPKKSFLERIFVFFRKLKKNIRDFFRKIKRIFRTIRLKKDYAAKILSLLREDDTKVLVCIIKDNVVHLWRKIKPKTVRGHLLFGTGDPASTGEILGVLAIFYAWYGDGIAITPDFQEKICEGDIFIRGGIRLFTVGMAVIHVLNSDEWKRVKKSFDRINAETAK